MKTYRFYNIVTDAPIFGKMTWKIKATDEGDALWQLLPLLKNYVIEVTEIKEGKENDRLENS